MLPILKEQFEIRKNKVLDLIESYAKEYAQDWKDIGIFGSYARGEANGLSDIDICIIAEKPSPYISGALREDADVLKADIVFVQKDQFLHSSCTLCQDLRRDIKFVKGGDFIEK